MSTKTKEKEPAAKTPPGVSFEDLRSMAGAGMENVRQGKDTQTPYLVIIQSGSPFLKRENAKYVKGAQAGDIINTVTGKVYKTCEPDGKPLIVVPVGFLPAWVEWKLRNLGGGFIKSHTDEMILAKTVLGGPKGKNNVLKDHPEHHIVQTAYHSVIVIDDEGRYPALIAMTSTQLKKSRKWNSTMGAIKVKDGNEEIVPPCFYKRYNLSTAVEKYTEGECYGWVITPGDVTTNDPALFKEAYAGYKACISTPALPAPPNDNDEPTFVEEKDL